MFRLKLCKLVLNTTHATLSQTRLLSITNKSFYFVLFCTIVQIFCTSSNCFVPVQTILYQFKLLCTSSKTNCSKVKIELQHIHGLNIVWVTNSCQLISSISIVSFAIDNDVTLWKSQSPCFINVPSFFFSM